MPVFEYKVAMTCSGCSGAVNRVLAKEARITNVDISLEVTADGITKDEVTVLVKKAGKETEVL